MPASHIDVTVEDHVRTAPSTAPPERGRRLSAAARRLSVVAVLLAASLGTVACAGDEEDATNIAKAGERPLDLQAADLGARQTASGTVSDVLSVNSFELVGALSSGEPLLVITPDVTPLRPGVRVSVEGTVEEFEDDSVDRFGLDGADLPPLTAGRRFLLAETVDAPVQGETGD